MKIGLRRFVKFKADSVLNMAGLSVTVAACLIIFTYTAFHFSFDKYVKDGENSYRLITSLGDGTFNANTFACYGKILDKHPEIKSYTVAYVQHNIQEIFTNENKFPVKDIVFTNSSFLDFFSVEMEQGNKSYIEEPNTAFVTREMANKWFPGQEVIGQHFRVRSFTRNADSLITYTIAGIAKPMPATSHLNFEILLSQNGHFKPSVGYLEHQKVYSAATCMGLYPGTDRAQLELQFIKDAEPFLKDSHGPPVNAFNLKLEPLHNIHFNTNITAAQQLGVQKSSLNILLLVGFLILAIAAINFANMHIARASFETKEYSVIKFLGGNNKHIFSNLFSEAFLSVLVSMIIGVALIYLFSQPVSDLFFGNWDIHFSGLRFWAMVGGLFLLLLFLVMMISSLNISTGRNGLNTQMHPPKNKIAIPLVVFQFVLVVGIISFSLAVNKQMLYVNEKELGYSPENVMIIRLHQRNAKVNVLSQELEKVPGVSSVSTAQHYPGYRLQDMTFSNNDNSFPFKFGFVGPKATDVFGIDVLKYFVPSQEKHTGGWLINETFYKHLKAFYSDEQIANGNFPKDETLARDDSKTSFVVAGVMKDFHYESLHSGIDNFALLITDPQNRFHRFAILKFEQTRYPEVIAAVKANMEKLFPGQPVDYSFLDEQLHQQYQSEQTLLKLINAFSFLSILVACLGLIGLSIFITRKRTKEIGVRKVNGAKLAEIVGMLNRDFAKWVIIAFVLATPLSWYAASQWLQVFAYKTNLGIWIFILSGVVALLVALLTVSWQSWKAARRNPVEALRCE